STHVRDQRSMECKHEDDKGATSWHFLWLLHPRQTVLPWQHAKYCKPVSPGANSPPRSVATVASYPGKLCTSAYSVAARARRRHLCWCKAWRYASLMHRLNDADMMTQHLVELPDVALAAYCVSTCGFDDRKGRLDV